MYPILLAVHNLMRWVVVLTAIWLLFRTYKGLFAKGPWTSQDTGAVRYFIISMDVQLLLGLVLYGVSPLVQAAMGNMGAAMGDDQLRFFAVEHLLMMVIAVVLAHVGSIVVKRAAEPRSKFVRSAIWFTLSTLVILASIPWWRPLFPAIF